MSDSRQDIGLEIELMRAMRAQNMDRVAELVEQGADIYKKISVEDLPEDLKQDLVVASRPLGLPVQLNRPIAIPSIGDPSDGQMRRYNEVIDRSAKAVASDLGGHGGPEVE